MKKKNVLKRILFLLCALTLVVLFCTHNNDIVEDAPLIPYTEVMTVAKQCDGYVDCCLLLNVDPQLYYNHFVGAEFVPTQRVALNEAWRYKLVYPRELERGESRLITTLPNDGRVITFYEDCVEIFGVTYLLPEERNSTYVNVLEWLDSTFDYICEYRAFYGIERIYPDDPIE